MDLLASPAVAGFSVSKIRGQGPGGPAGRRRRRVGTRDLPCLPVRWRVRRDVIDEVVMVVIDLLDSVVRRTRSGFCVLVELDERRLSVPVEDEPRPGARHPSGRRGPQEGRGAGRGWPTPRALSEPFTVPSGPVGELNRPPGDSASGHRQLITPCERAALPNCWG